MDFLHRDDYYMPGVFGEGEMAAVIDFRNRKNKRSQSATKRKIIRWEYS